MLSAPLSHLSKLIAKCPSIFGVELDVTDSTYDKLFSSLFFVILNLTFEIYKYKSSIGAHHKWRYTEQWWIQDFP